MQFQPFGSKPNPNTNQNPLCYLVSFASSALFWQLPSVPLDLVLSFFRKSSPNQVKKKSNLNTSSSKYALSSFSWIHFLQNLNRYFMKKISCKIFPLNSVFQFWSGFILKRISIFFFTGKSFVTFFRLILWRNSFVNWSGTSSRKFYKRIPFNFHLGSFYKGFPW